MNFSQSVRRLIDLPHPKYHGAPAFPNDKILSVQPKGVIANDTRIRLLGKELPSPGKQWLEFHHILLASTARIVLVEGMANLDALLAAFTLAAFPLNFRGRDGSPVRAVALCHD